MCLLRAYRLSHIACTPYPRRPLSTRLCLIPALNFAGANSGYGRSMIHRSFAAAHCIEDAPNNGMVLNAAFRGNRRPYNPISANARQGSFDLLVKRYENGGGRSIFATGLKPGQMVEFKQLKGACIALYACYFPRAFPRRLIRPPYSCFKRRAPLI